MKSLLLLLGLTLTSFALAKTPSVKTLPVEKFQSAGLHKLSSEELVALDAAIELLTAERIQALETEAKAAVTAAEQKAAATTHGGPSWFGALLTLQKAEAQNSDELPGVLKGTLKSFRGRRSFILENGQVWQMTEDDSYAGPAYDRPEVFIRPGPLGTFWLRIPQAAVRVKVKPQRLK